MANCSVCGISNENDDRVCAGCGSELAGEMEQKHETHPLNGEAAVFNQSLINDISGFGMVVDHEPESQLGKGLIKPHSIELEIDGFHFKYDKPARNFAKTETVREKVVEYRVTCPDSGSEASWSESPIGATPLGATPLGVSSLEGTSQPEFAPEKTVQEEISQEETSVEESSEKLISGEANSIDVSNNQQSPENEETIQSEAVEATPVEEQMEGEGANNFVESDIQSPDNGMWVAGEISTGTGADSTPDFELISDFELPEPELETDEDRVILWEDSERWFGIPLTKQYRISDHSLQIIDRLARKFSEVDLALISKVTIHQSWLDKLCKTGVLTVSVKHLPDTGLKLAKIRNPEKVRRLIEELIDKKES